MEAQLEKGFGRRIALDGDQTLAFACHIFAGCARRGLYFAQTHTQKHTNTNTHTQSCVEHAPTHTHKCMYDIAILSSQEPWLTDDGEHPSKQRCLAWRHRLVSAS